MSRVVFALALILFLVGNTIFGWEWPVTDLAQLTIDQVSLALLVAALILWGTE